MENLLADEWFLKHPDCVVVALENLLADEWFLKILVCGVVAKVSWRQRGGTLLQKDKGLSVVSERACFKRGWMRKVSIFLGSGKTGEARVN